MSDIDKKIRSRGPEDLGGALIEFHCQIRSADNARTVRRPSRFADLDANSANLLALRTRQLLGVQHLALAGRAEQSILGLF